jgi:hypothetical protein
VPVVVGVVPVLGGRDGGGAFGAYRNAKERQRHQTEKKKTPGHNRSPVRTRERVLGRVQRVMPNL